MVKLLERRRLAIVILVSLLVSLGLLITLQTNAIDAVRVRIDDLKKGDQKGEQKAEDKKEEEKEEDKDKYKHVERPTYIDAPQSNDTNTEEKLAYVTFLSGTVDQDDDLEKDNYLQAVRILIWQLVHVPETRTKHDVVVMCAPNVSQSRKDRLKKDGAIIYEVDFLHTPNDGWISPEQHRWDDVMTKMRVWEMTQYSRILMLDGDVMLRSSLDGVFDDPGSQVMQTKNGPSVSYKPLKGEAPLPDTYLLASLSEPWDSSHDFPPKEGTGLKVVGYMNAGFFMLAPSLPAFKYYTSLLDIPDSFDPRYPEQNLMNKAHEWSGPMPWRELDYKWNIRYPNENDFANGLVSVHEKWWKWPYLHGNQPVKDWLYSRRYEMKGWYDAKELFEKQQQKRQ